MNNETIEYTYDIQVYFIQFLMSSPDAFVRCRAILNPNYFDSKLQKSVKFILDYSDEYKTMPTFEELKAKHSMDIPKMEGLNANTVTAFLDQIEAFCRHKAMELLIFTGPELLKKGLYAEVEKRAKENMMISLQRDMGTDYFKDPLGRINLMLSRNNMVSTGWKSMDDLLYGGLNRGEITLFCGNSGMGKSLFLQNIIVNWSQMGLNVVYITAELSEFLTATRIDSMVTSIPAKDVIRKKEDIDLAVKMRAKQGMGKIIIKYLPSGSSANDIKAYVKELEIQTGVKIDGIAIDYLDLFYPNNKKINPSDLFVKDKFVTEEFRALAAELNVLMVSASQLNRAGIQEQEHDQSMIAGGISKVNTADNVISIYISEAMRERGEYRIQFLKTRSSSGVGKKLNLAFNTTNLRITDMETAGFAKAKDIKDPASELMEKRKTMLGTQPNSTAAEDKPVFDNTATGQAMDVGKIKKDGSNLRNLINSIKR